MYFIYLWTVHMHKDYFSQKSIMTIWAMYMASPQGGIYYIMSTF